MKLPNVFLLCFIFVTSPWGSFKVSGGWGIVAWVDGVEHCVLCRSTRLTVGMGVRERRQPRTQLFTIQRGKASNQLVTQVEALSSLLSSVFITLGSDLKGRVSPANPFGSIPPIEIMAKWDAKQAINQEKISKELPGKSLKHRKTSRIITQNASTNSEEEGLRMDGNSWISPSCHSNRMFQGIHFL